MRPPDFELKVFSELDLEPVEIVLDAKSGEVIAMNDEAELAGWMVKAARARGARYKSHLLQGSSVGILPNRAGVSCAIGATDQLADAVAGESELFREGHIYWSLGQTIKVRLPDVHKAELKTSSIAATLLRVASEKEFLGF